LEANSVGVWTRVAGLVLSLVLLSGCSQQSSATDDLIHALNETHSAIASSILAIELYDQQRSTQAVTDTVLGDMAKQAVDAEGALEPISVDSEQIESDRDAALAAVHAGVTALLSSRDEFSQHSAVANTAGLQSADQQVNAVLNQLRGSR
jgi:PBP1b-binding outer membrane lipoprotein LpoB